MQSDETCAKDGAPIVVCDDVQGAACGGDAGHERKGKSERPGTVEETVGEETLLVKDIVWVGGAGAETKVNCSVRKGYQCPVARTCRPLLG